MKTDVGVVEWLWRGVEASKEDISSIQPMWDIPADVVVTADIGHRHEAPEVTRLSIAAAKAGASAVHLHIRDDAGVDTGDLDLWTSVVEDIRKEAPKIVIDAGLRGGSFEERLARVRRGLLDVVPLNPTVEPEYLRKAAALIEENGARVALVVFDGADVALAESQLIDRGVLARPTAWLVDAGAAYFGMPMPNPILMTKGLVHLIELIRNADPDAYIMVCPAGRAATYMTTLAMLLGHHIRPGMGESWWRYPHRESGPLDPIELVSEAIAVARLLGREPAPPETYRRLLGLR